MDSFELLKVNAFKRAESFYGKTLAEVNGAPLDEHAKNACGDAIQGGVFGIPRNCNPAPDIDGRIEVKGMPVRKDKKGRYMATQKLIISMVNYTAEYRKDIYHSHFFRKTHCMLIIPYYMPKGAAKSDYIILHPFFLVLTDVEWNAILKDYDNFQAHLAAGTMQLYHEFEGYILILSTKGKNAKQLMDQPNSTIRTKTRAFAFRPGFATLLLRRAMADRQAA